MSSLHGAAGHIGRVGALAVALGIGAAVATGAPAASADTTRGDIGSASSAADTPSNVSTPTRRGSSAAARTSARSGSSALPRAAAAQRPTAKNQIPTITAPTNTGPVRVVAPAAPAASATVPQTVSPTVSFAAPHPAAVPVAAPLPSVAVIPATPRAGSLAAPRLLSRVISAIQALAGNSAPGVPLDSPALWALLGWTRRERIALPSAATALVSTPSSLNSVPLGWVTGQRNTAVPGGLWPQTNNTRWANIYGTDLGIMWFNGVNGKTQLAFGDTFSGPNMTGDWRSNVLLLSEDTNLTDGLSLIDTGPAYQFIPAARNQVFFIGSEVTNIPTSALYANSNNYVSYMSVKSWDTPGRWTTNYAAVAYSDDNGQTWTVAPSSIRSAAAYRTTTGYVSGNQNFQQSAFVRPPAGSADANYVYMYGTPSGRGGTVYLSRVDQTAVLDQTKYEYWNGTNWVPNKPAAATPILPATTTGFWVFARKTTPTAGEMSVQYNTYLNKYMMMYADSGNNVVMRTADRPEGPWSPPTTLATSVQYPGLYAPMMDPWTTGKDVYWNMSMWGDYNVLLMHTRLV